MSYALMVFEPAVGPRERAEFLKWYEHVWGPNSVLRRSARSHSYFLRERHDDQ